MDEVKALTEVDLTDFERQWFLQSAFQAEQALSALETSLFIPPYFELIAKRTENLASKQKA